MRTPLLYAAVVVIACSPRSTPSNEDPQEDTAPPLVPEHRGAPSDEPQMRFFVASTGVSGSADLGGLEGADRHCQALAAAAGAGSLTWRAYLSTADASDKDGVDARDRIGNGPWYNANRELIARDLASLHSEANGLTRQTTLTEHGEIPTRTHDILTGSNAAGRLAFTDGQPATCGNWTERGEGVARVGHSDRMDSESFANPRFKRWYGSWNSEHDTLGCGAKSLAQSGGDGAFYCFAADAFPPHLDRTEVSGSQDSAATFVHGFDIYDERTAVADDPAWPGDQDMVRIADDGFDHVRWIAAGHLWVGPDGNLNDDVVSHFDRALSQARRHGLGVVLTMASTPGFRDVSPATALSSPFADEATRGDAAYLWWLVARRYATMDAGLRFEAIDRSEAPGAEQMQVFNREVLAAIRRISSERVVYLTSDES